MDRNCPTTLLTITTSAVITTRTIITAITTITIMVGLLSCLAGRCLALPVVWPVTEDPNGKPVNEDRIGYENGSCLEFDYTLDPNAVIEYRVGEDTWGRFPHRLDAKKHTPHTVNILFNVSLAAAEAKSVTDAQSLVLAIRTDALLLSQHLGVFLDGCPIHPPGGEEIQPDPNFQKHTFWLGYMSRGEHRITLSNETTDTNSPFGILFDYVKLVPGAKVGISLAADAESTAVMNDFTALKPNDSAISGSVLPEAHFYAGLWKLRITGLKQGDGGLGQGDGGLGQGDWVKVEIHCPPESFFALQEYYAYDGPEHGWKAMQIQKDPARFTVTVELSDGGAGDGDPNQGSISHIGGIAVPFSLGGEYNYRGCFIASLKYKYMRNRHRGAKAQRHRDSKGIGT